MSILESTDNMTDLFEDYDSLPKPIRDLCDTMDFNNSYAKCKDFIKKIEEYGYTCDYDLDGSVYDLKLINCNPT